MLGIVYVLLDGPLVDELLSEPLYLYAILLFVFSLMLGLLIIYKSQTVPPSVVLLLIFLAVPIVGPFGYQVFIKVYGSFHGTQLTFAYPTFVWAVGTTALLFGILVVHFLIRKRPTQKLVFWNLSRASALIWFTLGVALFFSVYVIFKIGYLPVLSPSIDEVRKNYESIAGDYPLKLSRFWLLAASLSSMLLFIRKQKKLYLIILAISSLMLLIYGQRTYTFLVIISFVLIYFKFRRPNIIYLTASGLLMIIAFIFYADYRGGRSFKELALPEIVALHLFGEWQEYSFVVEDLRKSGDFYGQDLYIGALVPIFPKQVWAAFGIDKNKLIQEKNAVYIFGREFENELGIRIGSIGEAYAGYGLVYGVCLQMFLFGLIFGVLEKIYLNLNKLDARLCLVAFLISLLMSLPITTLYVTVAHAVFFGFFFVVYQLIATHRVANDNEVQNFSFANETLAKV
jgi:oligosaccharide repeat unit polymerase